MASRSGQKLLEGTDKKECAGGCVWKRFSRMSRIIGMPIRLSVQDNLFRLSVENDC